MNHSYSITAMLDQPGMLQEMVERLATRRYDIGYIDEIVPPGWEAIETSSTESYANGTMEIYSKENEVIRVPFITRFYFTCAHSKTNSYKLNWILSLS